MNVVALGGSGAMGRVALLTLASEKLFDMVTVADLDLEKAEHLAEELRSLGQPSRSMWLDVTDEVALRELLREADVVMNTVGPFFRFGVPILKAAIETGTRYFDICDDPEPTREMLDLDAMAREYGVTAVIGAGASPGVMNIFGALAVADLDEVHDMISAWSFDSEYQDWDLLRSFGGKSSAALEHFFQQFTETVNVFRDGEFRQVRARDVVNVDLPGVFSGSGYVVGHPEPVTFPNSFKVRDAVTSLCLMSSARAAEFSLYAEAIEAGRMTLAEAGHLVDERDERFREEGLLRASRYPGSQTLPIYLVVAHGTVGGVPTTRYVGSRTKPEPMSIGTGVPLAITVALCAESDMPAGVFPPERVLIPNAFLAKLAPHWDLSVDNLFFTGSITDIY